MTLYSRGISNRTESWTRSVITGVLWENRKAANVIASGILEADAVAVYIPTAGRSVTVKVGDVLVKGEVSEEIGSSFTITDLKKATADVVTVMSVDRYDFGSAHMQHLQIGAS